jgi:hypothetical protein
VHKADDRAPCVAPARASRGRRPSERVSRSLRERVSGELASPPLSGPRRGNGGRSGGSCPGEGEAEEGGEGGSASDREWGAGVGADWLRVVAAVFSNASEDERSRAGCEAGRRSYLDWGPSWQGRGG